MRTFDPIVDFDTEDIGEVTSTFSAILTTWRLAAMGRVQPIADLQPLEVSEGRGAAFK
jgi:hypothetical protein